jgi:hypothetical protein
LALHSASTVGSAAVVEAAKALRQTVDKIVGILASRKFGPTDVQALLIGVVDEGLSGEYADFSTAEQATMALGSITEAMRKTGSLDKGSLDAMKTALNASYEAVKKDEDYQPASFAEALKRFKAAIPKF